MYTKQTSELCFKITQYDVQTFLFGVFLPITLIFIRTVD